MDETNKIDVVFIGAGPASLAGAIRLKQLLNQKGRLGSVVVIEKAETLGQHNLSGAIFEADVLDELLPGWRQKKDAFVTRILSNQVKRDEFFFLLGNNSAIKIPEFFVPPYLCHKGNFAISISEMVKWLGGIAGGLGVDIYNGFVAKELVFKDNLVKGVKLGDKGMDQHGKRKANYIPGEVLEAKVTVLGEGSLGLLSAEMVRRFGLGTGRNPQVYSLGVKEVIKLPKDNNFGTNRVIHTMGFPNRLLTPDVFGGGTMYSMGKDTVAVALLLALDWRYCDLNPQRELQIFKSHSLVRNFLEGGEVIAYGAHSIPEGGYFSIPKLVTDGAIIIGDAAGLTSVRKLKGLHYAIKSGMIAAESIFNAIEEGDFSRGLLKTYEDSLEKSFIMEDIRTAKNYRQVFSKSGKGGFYLGTPLSLIQQAIPFKLGSEPDFKSMGKTRLNRKYCGGIDRPAAVSLSGTSHREDEPPHIIISDPLECTRCEEDYGCYPCEYFCPAEVYKFKEGKLVLSTSNCLHCQTCRVKCPRQVIKWQVPEGGEGPKYKVM